MRRKRGELLVEGPQAVLELLRWRPETVRDVYCTEAVDAAVAASSLAREAQVYFHFVTDQVAHAVGDQTQGIFAVCADSAVRGSLEEVTMAPGPVVILPQTKDPGNAGTIIRAADAFGAAGVVACTGTVDLASPKVIRASAGSVFHLPIVVGADFDVVADSLGRPLYGAAGEGTGLGGAPLGGRHAWVFGNEAQGLSEVQISRCSQLISVPMSGNAESLNVALAAGICLFASQEARREDQ